MYSPEAISRDISSNLMYSSSSSSNHGFKNGFIDGGSFFKSKEILGSSSDLFQTQNQNQNSGLMRYRSAPSSYFASYLDGYNNTPPPPPPTTTNNSGSNNGDSSESESIFSALMNNCSEIEPRNDLMSQRHHHHNQVLQVSSCPMKLEMNEVQSNPQQQFHRNNGNGKGFSCANNNSSNDMVQIGGYQAAVSAGGGTVVGSYTVPVGMENQLQMRINNNNNSGNRSNLIRQSSSPAGFFSGFNVMRGEVGKFGNNGETSSSNSGLNFASGPPCSGSSRYMPSIAEHGNETVETGSPDNNVRLGNLNETSTTTMAYPSGFSTESWKEPPPPPPPAAPPTFSILKRNRDGDFKLFSDFNRLEDHQDGETRNYSHTLTHHLSLPKTAGEMAVIEKYLQFQQDSVPCKIRAKRGCATHPRSIAERMRRTRISQRMKKLQELFPNMDKQTNTADMLDLAVEYIKDLQNQVQTLTETRAKCKCSSKPTPSTNAKA